MIASNKEPESVYIHIPFCSHKCDFCDFAAFSGLDNKEDEYTDALLKEMDERLAARPKGGRLNTVFYGGGTPGLAQLSTITKIQAALKKQFDIAHDAEVSLETTPHAISVDKAKEWLKMGINRLSIGIESFHDNELTAMGRDHTRAMAFDGIEAAHQAGFSNISLDFMYGLPMQTLDSFKSSLEEAIALSSRIGIQHISAYGLEIAINAPLLLRYPRDSKSYPDEEQFVAMYELLVQTLRKAGFAQYEISNFARPGYESRHNIVYWKNEPYFAFGVGAHRYVDGVRSGNSKSFNKYLRNYLEGEQSEVIDDAGQILEGIMLGLRMVKGIHLEEFKSQYGVDIAALKQKEISLFTGEGLMELSDGYLKITERGLPISNSIIARLI